MSTLNIALNPIPDLPTLVAETIAIGQGSALPIKINFRNNVTEFSAAKRTLEYNAPGLTGSQVAELQALVENNLRNLLRRTDPVLKTISLCGLVFEGCFIRSVVPSGSLTIEGEQLINDTKITYETLGYALV